jgi:DNA-binding CsgD family transcriptional regulator
MPQALRALVAAHEGDGRLDALLEAATATLQLHRLGVMEVPVSDLLRWTRGARAAGVGEGNEAVHHLSQIQMPVLQRLTATARISAAVVAGEHSMAREWADEVSAYAAATGSAWARAASLHAAALLTDDPAPQLEQALLAHAETDRPFDRACASLALGEHLRRSGRRLDARQHLRSALEGFGDLGAEPFAERASRELRASGETARRRNPATRTDLTPTEMTISHLVSRGMSNKEVAEQCWVSPRTVAFHLRNVFAKTGVSSRAQLAQLGLGDPAPS